jgi:hypothetical protein
LIYPPPRGIAGGNGGMKQEPDVNGTSQNIFSSLDIQFIRASLSSKTDEEIAEILDKPVALVRTRINEMTGMAGQRQTEILLKNEEASRKAHAELQAKKINRRIREQKAEEHQDKLEKEEKKERKRKERLKHSNIVEAQYVARQQRNDRRKFKTIPIDLAKLISVKIDKKTTLFVKPGTDIKKVREQYQKLNKKTFDGTHTFESESLPDY